MSSEVKIRNSDFMESQTENESLRTRIREVEDENQELRAQSLLQNRTITELRNEIVLLRIQITEMADTSALLRERVRTLVQNSQQRQDNTGSAGPVTAPPLMAPPPVPPPLPPARIRISPRQVGAGEALTTPLGVSLSSPPRHRIKRDCRQGLYKTGRIPYRRFDGTEPGPSSQTQFYTPERPNYFVGLKIIPQFQPFLCSSNQCGGSDSASDSSGSDENPQLTKKPKPRPIDGEPSKNPPHISKGYDLLKNVRNIQQQKVRQSILQNYNFALPGNSKFFFPIPWDRRNKENFTQPSTSGNEVRYFQSGNPSTSERVQTANSTHSNGGRKPLKVSDCVQYTFPAIHEGLHHSGLSTVIGNGGPPSRVRKYKKNIPYLSPCSRPTPEEAEKLNEEKVKIDNDSESISSSSGTRSSRTGTLDFEQDGFQADESSNCLTSTDNSLEHICMGSSPQEKKD